MEWTWNADILREDNIKMDDVTLNLDVKRLFTSGSLKTVVRDAEKCRSQATGGEKVRQDEQETERTEVITFYVETR